MTVVDGESILRTVARPSQIQVQKLQFYCLQTDRQDSVSAKLRLRETIVRWASARFSFRYDPIQTVPVAYEFSRAKLLTHQNRHKVARTRREWYLLNGTSTIKTNTYRNINTEKVNPGITKVIQSLPGVGKIDLPVRTGHMSGPTVKLL